MRTFKTTLPQHTLNRDTPELRIFRFSQLILGYKQTKLKFRGIALINGKSVKHIGDSIMNGRTPCEAITEKVCLCPWDYKM